MSARFRCHVLRYNDPALRKLRIKPPSRELFSRAVPFWVYPCAGWPKFFGFISIQFETEVGSHDLWLLLMRSVRNTLVNGPDRAVP